VRNVAHAHAHLRCRAGARLRHRHLLRARAQLRRGRRAAGGQQHFIFWNSRTPTPLVGRSSGRGRSTHMTCVYVCMMCAYVVYVRMLCVEGWHWVVSCVLPAGRRPYPAACQTLTPPYPPCAAPPRCLPEHPVPRTCAAPLPPRPAPARAWPPPGERLRGRDSAGSDRAAIAKGESPAKRPSDAARALGVQAKLWRNRSLAHGRPKDSATQTVKSVRSSSSPGAHLSLVRQQLGPQAYLVLAPLLQLRAQQPHTRTRTRAYTRKRRHMGESARLLLSSCHLTRALLAGEPLPIPYVGPLPTHRRQSPAQSRPPQPNGPSATHVLLSRGSRVQPAPRLGRLFHGPLQLRPQLRHLGRQPKERKPNLKRELETLASVATYPLSHRGSHEEPTAV
jgi:hypothetical protein